MRAAAVMMLTRSAWRSSTFPAKHICTSPGTPRFVAVSRNTSNTIVSAGSPRGFSSGSGSGFSPCRPRSAPTRCTRHRPTHHANSRWPGSLRHPHSLQLTRRRFSSSSSSSSSSAATSSSEASTSTMPLLAPFVSELDQIAPAVDLDASQITILETPSEFYETLKGRIRGAQRRVFLSTLYIGKEETELITTIQEAMRANPSLNLYILTDLLRGTREEPEPCSASLLAPLVHEFSVGRVKLHMYLTPNLAGIKRFLVPRRINEGWGLQHMKLYGIDDEIILTGANLSGDYFTNRQDRYHLFSSREIADYFFKLQQAISSFTFIISPFDSPAGFKAWWLEDNLAPNPLGSRKAFVQHTTKAMHTVISPPPPPEPPSLTGCHAPKNTRVYLLTQTSQLLKPDTSTELPVLTHVLRTLALPVYKHSSWVFTAGYFNPAPALTNLLLGTASSRGTVITAHPAANGFYKSQGVSGMLPDAYTHLVRRFLNRVHRAGRDAAITLREWRRGTVNQPDGWTYHAKGLWVTMPGDTDPSITLVGSSNYTKRSYSLDLEAGALIVTRDEQLKKRLGQEQRWLQQHTTPVTTDDLAKSERRTGIRVRLAMWIVSALGGAL